MNRDIALKALAILYRADLNEETIYDTDGNVVDIAQKTASIEATIEKEHKDHHRIKMEATNVAMGNRPIVRGR